jgi:ribonuclease G
LTDQIERDLEFIVNSHPDVKITLQTHPYVLAYLKKGMPSFQHKWYLKYRKWIKIKEEGDFAVTKYKFYDKNNDEIRLN